MEPEEVAEYFLQVIQDREQYRGEAPRFVDYQKNDMNMVKDADELTLVVIAVGEFCPGLRVPWFWFVISDGR